MEKSSVVTFISSHFRVEPDEDAKTNPGIYGRALGRWLSAQLGKRGFSPKEVAPEDWGWCVIVKTEPVRLCLAVSNADDSRTRWSVFVFAERGLLQWLSRSGDPKREVAAMREHLAAVVSSVPDVQDITWETLP